MSHTSDHIQRSCSTKTDALVQATLVGDVCRVAALLAEPQAYKRYNVLIALVSASCAECPKSECAKIINEYIYNHRRICRNIAGATNDFCSR